MDVFKEITPLLRELGSARRSPTAGSSDIVRPNPIDRVSDMAPQGPHVVPQSPDMAPGPSSASFDPRSLGSSHHDALRDDVFVSPRGGVDKGEHVPVGIRHRSPSTSPSHQQRLRDEMENVHAEMSHIRDLNDFCRARGRAPPDQSHRDLEMLQAKYAQLSLALEESLHASSSHRRGRSPSFASHRVASPSAGHRSLRPDSSSLHGPHLSTRPRSPSQDRSRSRDDYSGHRRHSRRSQERYVERFGSSAAPSHGRRPRSRGSPSPKRLEFSRESPSQHEMRFASRSPLRNTRCDSHHKGHLRNTSCDSQQGSASPKRMGFASRASPSPKRMGFASDSGPSTSKRPLSRDSPSQRPRSSRDSLSPRRGSPSSKRQRYESRDSDSPRRRHSSRASSREASLERPHSRSSPTHPYSPSREDKEAEDTSMPAPVKAMIDFIMQSFPEATASPAHPSSRSFDLSASAGVTDAATPSGSLLAWCHAMSDSFADTQKRFSQRIKDGRVCHSLLPTLHRFERVSNSPTQGKELKANPDILDLLRNKVPDFRQLPISIKEGISIERSLRSCLESHNFLTWSVMALIKALHEKKLLPKDDPVISQLQKSFSKACSNVTSGLTANTAFVTMKRRQLLLSHVVPSVSEAQKRNLLSDPFFQTGSLFDASSVESARSAARDLSLFKPHLKASSSTSQSRRQPYSSSSAQRGSARHSSRPSSSSQRSSSPFRQQSGKKGDSRFQKKSSGTPHKRGGFRK